MLAVTQPAPTTGAVRPQVRYTYTRLDANGATSATGVFRLTGTSTCQTQTSCAGTADEVKTTAVYGQNQNVASVTTAAGDNSLSTPSAYTYDAVGNRLTVDGPIPGTADTTVYRYDANRRVIGIVSPDPDGGGTGHPNRAVRVTYRPDGLISKKELGTVTDQSDAAWTAFAVGQTIDDAFDTNLRRVSSKLSASGTDYAFTQMSYDSLGRVDCVAQRMDRNQFTADAGLGACTLGTNTDPQDRITKNIYDAAGQVTQTQVGFGTTDVATEKTLTYTNNGKLLTLKDAENNLTTYVYDGFDRLSQTQYPSATRGSGTSNASDNVQLTYDANSNITRRTLRNANSIAYAYDNLNRLTTVTADPLCDRAYTYDLLSRMLTAKFITCGETVTNAFDALGRLTSSTTDAGGTARALSYQYDLAGRRTRLTWWDGVYVDYDRLVTGELSAMRLNGATSGSGVLSAFAYDDLGDRITLTRGNGLATSYSYDAVARLTSLSHDLAGSASDVTIGGLATPITYNPASQILSAPKSNDAYAWTGHYNVSRTYTSNGLNEHVTAGPANFTYDTNGNLTTDGTSTFAYDPENKLSSVVSLGTTKTLTYDPLNRLDRYVAGSTTRRFIYDGAEAVAELDGTGAMLRRFVRGDGADEVLLEYTDATTSNPRYHHLDERGSDIAWSDSTGAMSAISTYNEYGVPGSSNPGRFEYTGQMWLSEIGVYNYKNRIYSPYLGRFLQTDPIGYGDGPNWYNYVHSDPVNGTDSLGLGTGVAVLPDTPGCAGIRYATCSGGAIGGPYAGAGYNYSGNAPYYCQGGLCGQYVGIPGFDPTWLPSFSRGPSMSLSDLSSIGANLYQPDYGAAAISSGAGGSRYLCLITCATRSLTAAEKAFYGSRGLPTSVLNSAVLHQGLPLAPYLGNVSGYTVYNDVYLAFGIGPAFASPWITGDIGHELYHVWQYQLGADPAQFAFDQMYYGHDNSPLEIPAIKFGNAIQACRTSGSC